MSINIDAAKCTGCGSCVAVCPFGLVEIVNERPRIRDGCNLCGACRDACGFEAITIESLPGGQPVSDEHRGVWVFAEQHHGQIRPVVGELLAKGRELADNLHTDLSAVCIGEHVDNVADLVSLGADKIYLLESPRMAGGPEALYRAALADAGLEPAELKGLIVGSGTPSRQFPGLSAELQKRLGCPGIPAFDVHLASSGGFIALCLAAKLCEGLGPTLVVGAEKMSEVVQRDFAKETAILFGDGAGAAVVAPGGGSTEFSTYFGGTGIDALYGVRPDGTRSMRSTKS